MNNVPFHVPLIGQSPSREQAAKEQIMAAVNQMATGIYVQVATSWITTRDPSLESELNKDRFHGLAKTCRDAALGFFEGLGVIQTQEQPV